MDVHCEEASSGPRRLFEQLPVARLAHGYLFTGAAGVGKKHFARHLAKSLLCEMPKIQALGYDDTCSSCRLFDAQTHPDLLIHEGEIKIGDRDGVRQDELTARDLVRALSLHAYGSGRRVLILADVVFATHHAANALLKFFEEPPQGVVLILTTSAPGKLIATIRSRLIEVVFPPLSRQAVERILVTSGAPVVDAARTSAAAQGSVTRARALLEERGLQELVSGWFFDAVAGRQGDTAWAVRATLDEGLNLLGLLIRDWAVHLAAGSRAPASLSGEVARIHALPKTSEASLQALNALSDAQRLARTNVSPALVSEGLRLALAQCGAMEPTVH